MSSYRIERSGSLRGSCVVPGDKSIGHRGLIFAALASGPSRLRGLSSGLDNLATEAALRAMGVRIDRQGDQAEVFGVGLDGLSAPKGVLDCGNSGTTIRLLTGLLVGQPFATQLTGDASLSRRPMGRIVEPLRARGAHLEGAA
ncbi:MAG: 3-phosphoshikimate 1-carboxyvinyltransferase, partial [Myxococcales bacterium]|nr:3-phosphoshikimate 1-carboxyvinyltransferase [Myxococcales bacterium]